MVFIISAVMALVGLVLVGLSLGSLIEEKDDIRKNIQEHCRFSEDSIAKNYLAYASSAMSGRKAYSGFFYKENIKGFQ